MARDLKESKINKRVITVVVTYDFADQVWDEVKINDKKAVEEMVSKWVTDYFDYEEVPMPDLKVSCEDFYEED